MTHPSSDRLRPARGARLLAAAVALLLPIVACGRGAKAPEEDLLSVELQGIAALERYDEESMNRAIALLRRVVERAPEWREARINLALALSGTHRVGETAEALKEYERVLAEDPWNPYALFQVALVHRFQGRADEAIPYLERLYRVDPDDPGVHYWLGTLELERNQENPVSAEAHLRRAHELSPNDPSFVYGLFTSLARQGKGTEPEATKLLETFRALEEAKGFGSGALEKHLKRGQNEYGEAGRYAFAIRDLAPPAGPVFADATATSGLGAASGTGLACGDFDGDGDDDLYLADRDGHGTLWRNDGGRFVDATAGAGLDGVRGTAALFADVDDDGALDLAVAGDTVRVFHNAGKGQYTEVPPERLSPAAAARYDAISFADLDHDGDLDLLAAGRRCAWIRNRRDGTFSDATDERGVGGTASTLVAFDADGDFILDLVRFGPTGPPVLLKNGRLEPFAATTALAGLGDAVSGTVGDADGDGLLDVVLVRPDGRVALARGNGRGAYALDATFPTWSFDATAAAVADFDQDGRPDVMLVGRRVTLVRGLPRGGWSVAALALPEADRTSIALADFDGDGDLDVVLAVRGAPPTFLRNTTPRTRHALRVRLQGVADKREGRTWTNVRGIGADVEAKAGDLVGRAVVLAGSGFPGQATDEVIFGFADRPRADSVRVRWTDGVLQSEFEVPMDRPYPIAEVNRKIASCPVLFAWTGSQFEYVTDTLGAGGLGFYVGPPSGYAPPDPTEMLRLPRLASRGGRYVVTLVENLEEVSYLDEARLVVVDHPAGLVVHPDERFAVDLPLPTERFYAFDAPIVPVSAKDDRGRDVLEKILAEDREYVDGFRPDPRFLGFAEDHALVLDFGERLASVRVDERLVLVLAGWIEYGYGRTVAAAAQAGISMEPPVLEVEDGRGGWKKAASIGYPAGNPRTMTYDVTGVLGPATTRCRIRTNLEIDWDRVYVARDVAGDRLLATTVLPASAALRARGYPREYSPDGKSPTLYDYSVCESWIPYRTIPGAYTRFGDVTPLVTATDDRFAIFGKGEEVVVEFASDALPPLAPGRERSFFLRLDGYCKDRDPYTGGGDAVEPLPFHAMSNYPYPKTERFPDDPAHREYRARWNTREVR